MDKRELFLLVLVITAVWGFLLFKATHPTPKVIELPRDQFDEIKSKLAKEPRTWPEWPDGKG